MKTQVKNRLFTRALCALALLGLTSSALFADIHDRIEYKIGRVITDLEIANGNAGTTVILQQDLPYTIPAPGNYVVGENLSYTGSGAAITNNGIANVNLDLNGYTIDLGAQGLIGIASSGNNVKIHNGTIRNGNLNGTVADDFIFYVPSVTNPFLSPNPSSFNVRTAGISLTGSENVALYDLTIDSFLYGIASVNTVGKIYVSEVNTVNCGNYIAEPNPNPAAIPPATLLEPVGAGLLVAGSSTNPIVPQPVDPTFAGFAKDVLVQGCNFNNSKARYSALFISCNNVEIENCTGSAGRQAVISTAAVGSPTGVYLTATANFEFVNSQFGRVSNSLVTGGNTGVGIYWSKSIMVSDVNISDMVHNGLEGFESYNCSVVNCVASRGSDSEANVYSGRGFLALASENMTFDSCIASDFTLATTPTNLPPRSVVGAANGNGYGFVISASKACSIINCTAVNNIGGFSEVSNALGTAAILFPGGSTLLPIGSIGVANDWNVFTKNIGVDNTNSTAEFGAPLNNFSLQAWQPVPVAYTALNTAGAWANISVPL